MEQVKLAFKTKIGYSFGMLGESLAINTFLIYFMFFLTDAVGIDPGIAGTIVVIGAVWGAFTDLLAGVRSDASRNPKGKRRPFIFKSAVVLGIAIFLIYTDWGFIPMSVKPLYYVLILLIFYGGVSFADIPYQSLGSEITEDFGERVQIRSYANVINYAGMVLASSGSLTLVSFFVKNGSTYSGAWSKVGLAFGIIAMLAYWLSALATKGKEPANDYPDTENAKKFTLKEIFKNYREIIKLKAYKPVLVYSILMYGGMVFFTSMYIYYLTNNMGYSEGQSAIVGLTYSIMVMILSVIFGFFKIDAKKVVTVSMLLWGVSMCIAHFFTLNTFGIYFIFFMFSIGMSGVFVQTYAILYDICDIDEYISGKNRAGYIMSLFYFISKILSAISIFAIGWILKIVGYDAMQAHQSAATLNGISFGTFFLSGILAVLAAIAIWEYPGTNKRLEAMRKALTARKEGRDYLEDNFKELL